MCINKVIPIVVCIVWCIMLNKKGQYSKIKALWMNVLSIDEAIKEE